MRSQERDLLEKLKKSFEPLYGKKNLLAFSGGVDSSALFFLLLSAKVEFDVACVNYQTRKNSDLEAKHVEEQAKKYHKKAYITTCKLKSSNFEHRAREARYSFFEKTIQEHGYENLLLAHQFDDRFEWFMMQLCKGAGLCELLGFEQFVKKDGYDIVRPLFALQKKELKEYLEKNSLPYFEDESNFDTKYKRNEFRHNVTSPLLEKYANGIERSFRFLQKDSRVFHKDFFYEKDDVFIYKLENDVTNMRHIDFALKRLGVLMSENSRIEALKPNVVIARKIAVGKNEKYGFVAPFVKVKMSKEFKEKCRVAKIPPHIRGYLFSIGFDVENLV